MPDCLAIAQQQIMNENGWMNLRRRNVFFYFLNWKKNEVSTNNAHIWMGPKYRWIKSFTNHTLLIQLKLQEREKNQDKFHCSPIYCGLISPKLKQWSTTLQREPTGRVPPIQMNESTNSIVGNFRFFVRLILKIERDVTYWNVVSDHRRCGWHVKTTLIKGNYVLTCNALFSSLFNSDEFVDIVLRGICFFFAEFAWLWRYQAIKRSFLSKMLSHSSNS